MRPVWQFELVRGTNAPFHLVREALLDGHGHRRWHPRRRRAAPQIVEDGGRFVILCSFDGLWVREDAWYTVEKCKIEKSGAKEDGGRLLLTYKNRFRGWPVIIMMGWWRIRSERLWERFIASLASSE